MGQKKENQTIKEKADFIMNNSGLIFSKLSNPKTYEETIDNLAYILLTTSEMTESDIQIKVNDLLGKKDNIIINYTNSYENSIRIIFELCKYINNMLKDDQQKINILNILRKYPKRFIAPNNGFIENNNLVYINPSNHIYIKTKVGK